MEQETLFINAGKPWTPTDELKLKNLYNDNMLDIMEISSILKREPGGILSRLKKENCITDKREGRGYMTYINSDLYKQKQEKRNLSTHGKITTLELKNETIIKETPTKSKIKLFKSDYLCLNEEVKEMKLEIIELKHTIKEMIEMMKAIYEFDATQ